MRILFGVLSKRMASSKATEMNVQYIRALSDNYMYLISDTSKKECALVDPVEPDKALDKVKKDGLTLTAILTTHHHWDHAGGNEKLLQTLRKEGKDVKIYGGCERVEAITDVVKHEDTFKIGGLDVKCLFTPCHTSSHICYHVTKDARDSGAVFTGDTLFVGGCGRFFEGTAQQMHHSLIEVLGRLPSDTKVYCGHEYTLKNLQFAQTVEPDNVDVREKLSSLSRSEVCVPSTIEQEFKWNPFMRLAAPGVMKFAGSEDPVKVMAAIRAAKDRF